MKTLLILYVLIAGTTEVMTIETESEQNCAFVAAQLSKGIDLPIVDPSASRLSAAYCAEDPPPEAVPVAPLTQDERGI